MIVGYILYGEIDKRYTRMFSNDLLTVIHKTHTDDQNFWYLKGLLVWCIRNTISRSCANVSQKPGIKFSKIVM